LSSTTEEIRPKIPWLLVLLISILLPIISTFWWSLETGAWAPNFTLGPSQTSFNFAQGAFLVPLVLIGFSWFLKKPISLRTLTFAYVTSLMALSANSYTHPGCQFTGFMHSRENPIHDPYLPTWWIPQKEVVSLMFMGGQTVDWGAWTPNILFWWLMPFFYWLYLSSGVLIFRRAWIVNEALPYPYGLSALTMVQLATTREKELSTQKRFFTYGFVIGFIFFVPFALANLFPFLPDIYGWTRPPYSTWTPGSIDLLGVYPALASIVGFGMISLNPLVYALLFFAPLNVLFSTWFFWVVIDLILVQVLYVMGYFSGMETQGTWDRGSRITMGDPLRLGPFTMLGVLPGILIWWILMNRRYFAATIRLAIGQGSPDEKAWEAGELSYAYNYVLLIIGFIGLLGIYVASGITPEAVIAYLIGIGVTYIAMARIHGYLGPQPHGPFWAQGLGKWRYPNVTMETRDQSQIMLGSLSGWYTVEYRSNYGSADQTMDGMRFSEDARVDSKSVYKAMFVSSIIAPLVGFVTFVAWSHYYGVMKLPFPHESDWVMMSVGDPENWNAWPAPDPWWPHALLGFVVAGVLLFLRIRVPWLPLDPYGLVMATAHWETWGLLGIGSAALGAWIVKTILIRVGGAGAYRNYGMPIAAGLIGGYIIAVPLLAGLGGVLRFFFPA